MVGWSLTKGEYQTGPNSYSGAIWFLPSNGAGIMVEKTVMNGVAYWSRDLQYTQKFNTPFNGTLFYQIDTVLGSNAVTYVNQHTFFNGLQAISCIGGLAVFLYIFHQIGMAIVELFVDNDSILLGGSKKAGYDGL